MFKKIVVHVFVWVAILVINLTFIGGRNPVAGLFELICVALYAAVFYTNVLWLFPEYYESKRYRYIFIAVVLIALSLFIIGRLNDFLFDRHDSRHHERIDWFQKIMQFRHILWLLLVLLAGTVYSIQKMLNNQIARHKEMMEEKLQTELQLLKAQINPHFLFNALNNIYALTYMKSEKAPESVLRLSEMLRYVIEDCSEESVLLSHEISYISSFIDFYKMKNPGERNIRFTHEIQNTECHISPMLFIPFIENSFKYSRIEEDKAGYIHISLHESSFKIKFNIRNSVFKERAILAGSGKGIANVRQRLEIIYPGKYVLSLVPAERDYEVNLEIDLK
jgi:two-component system, LytTR family, sensor kinase